jgi:hypothetical protein
VSSTSVSRRVSRKRFAAIVIAAAIVGVPTGLAVAQTGSERSDGPEEAAVQTLIENGGQVALEDGIIDGDEANQYLDSEDIKALQAAGHGDAQTDEMAQELREADESEESHP